MDDVKNIDNLAFEDELDCAILNDTRFMEALANIDTAQSTAEEETNDDDEQIDIHADYTNDLHEPDFISVDADEMIAAEREIELDPFEDEEIIDAALGDGAEEMLDDEVVEDDVLEEI